jgi:hypothetical protein
MEVAVTSFKLPFFFAVRNLRQTATEGEHETAGFLLSL